MRPGRAPSKASHMFQPPYMRSSTEWKWFGALLVALILNPLAGASNKLYVDGVNGNDQNDCRSPHYACKTIGHAISLAASGDDILVGPATYNENLTIQSVSGNFFSLAIIGSGASTTIIDGQQSATVLILPDSTTHIVLSGLTIRNGATRINCGAGIFNNGFASISDSIISDNQDDELSGSSYGSGLCNYGTLTLNRSTVTANVIRGYFSTGCGIFNLGTMTINDSTISDNVSTSTDSSGAGIYNAGMLVVNRSTISGNSLSGFADGGGIANGSIAFVNNSTISGNNADAYGDGGGIDNEFGTIMISNVTLEGNLAGRGSAILNASGAAVILQNTIATSDIATTCFGSVTSDGYNLSSDSSCNLNGPGDLNNADPKLGALRDNGGPTQTMSLLEGSPAIDAGNPGGCADGQGNLLKTDQRGAPRPDKEDTGGCDMGAYERQSD